VDLDYVDSVAMFDKLLHSLELGLEVMSEVTFLFRLQVNWAKKYSILETLTRFHKWSMLEPVGSDSGN